jgi:type I restriction enzyme, S subunit
MTVTAETFPRAFAIRFKELERWDPVSFERITWHWPKELMVPIGSILKARKEKVDRSRFAFSELQPITIHFDGSIDRRDVDGDREYTMELFFARPGDIVVAKIDLKNGAVGIVPPDWRNVVVTGHFSVYEPDRSRLLPEYLHRIIQTSFFKALLWRNKVGAEGRKEVKLDFFESLQIPLPPLPIQQAVVERWEKAQKEIAETQRWVEQLKTGIDVRFFQDLGLTSPKDAVRAKCFGVLWKNFQRWGVSYNQAVLTGTDLSRGKYPVVELGSVLELIQYGTSEKANAGGEGTPVLRINNIKDRAIDFADLKYVQLPAKVREELLLKEGDILIIRTSGSRDLVGTCAIFHGNSDFVFASYLIRLRIMAHKAIPDFVSWFLNSALGRQQIDATSRQIMQNNINSTEIAGLLIPLPPMVVQHTIMRKVEAGCSTITQEQKKARQLAIAIKREIEEMIIGTRLVPETHGLRKLSV